MNRKLYFGLGVFLIGLLCGFVFVYVKEKLEGQQLQNDLAALQQRIDARNKEKENANTPETETLHQHDQDHADETSHILEQDEPKEEYTAPEGAVLKPVFPKVDPKADPVKAAYERLEYIRNNPYAWGGVHSARATELIDQLMSESGPIRVIDHNHGDQVIELIEELCEQGDPRAARVLIAHMCDGDTIGRVMFNALDDIGPPAVPYIIPYLEKSVVLGGYIRLAVFESLNRIGTRYRDDLGGIVDHIIIPKLKVIAADENNKRYESPCPSRARETLDLLQ